MTILPAKGWTATSIPSFWLRSHQHDICMHARMHVLRNTCWYQLSTIIRIQLPWVTTHEASDTKIACLSRVPFRPIFVSRGALLILYMVRIIVRYLRFSTARRCSVRITDKFRRLRGNRVTVVVLGEFPSPVVALGVIFFVQANAP